MRLWFLTLGEQFTDLLVVALAGSGVGEGWSHRVEFIDSESGVVCGSPSYLWELFRCFSSFFIMCSEEKPGHVIVSVFTGRCTTSESSS